uniref:Putative methyltransferase n=1 Tax=viral metagenome TaxID=1070528 RepID=A0A6M3XTQ3_9ZZZZ
MPSEIFVPKEIRQGNVRGIVDVTNNLIDKCITENWDYLWIVEGDVIVPPHALKTLLNSDVDIALGCYPYHTIPDLVMAGFFYEENGIVKIRNLLYEEVEENVFEGMVFAGIGCALIKRSFLVESRLRFVCAPEKMGHDLEFLYNAQKLGYKVKLHGDVVCEHVPSYLPNHRFTVKVNIGCGQRHFRNNINVDVRRNVKPNVLCDVRCLPFRKNCVGAASALHVLEHFSSLEHDAILTEWLRVLEPNGILEVECPDISKAFQSEMKMDILYGEQDYPGNIHKWGFTQETLKKLLEAHGLKTVSMGYMSHGPMINSYVRVRK